MSVNKKQNIQHSSTDETRIVNAAKRHFRRFGYGKTAMHDIATACRMSAANLYRFYPGKLAIASAVVRSEQGILLENCDQAVASAIPGVARQLVALLQAVIDGHRRHLRQSPLLYDLGLKVSREDPAMRRQFLDEIEARILALLVGSRDCDAATFNRMKDAAQLILVGSAPFVLPWMMSREPFGDPRPRVEPLVAALVSGLGLDSPARPAVPRFG